jgi:hypothetical protein
LLQQLLDLEIKLGKVESGVPKNRLEQFEVKDFDPSTFPKNEATK